MLAHTANPHDALFNGPVDRVWLAVDQACFRSRRKLVPQFREMTFEISALKRKWAVRFLEQEPQILRKRSGRKGEPLRGSQTYFQEMLAPIRNCAACAINQQRFVKSTKIDNALIRFDQLDRAYDGIGKRNHGTYRT